MKPSFLILIILFPLISFWAASPLTAQETNVINPQAEFNRGNFLFEQQNYIDALEVYRGIVESGFESGPLFLNMGMSYAYMDSLGLAVFYFTKAHGFRQTRQQAETALSFVEAQLSQRQTIIPELATFQLNRYLFFELGHFTPLLIALILLNLAVLFWVSIWFLKKHGFFLKGLALTFFLASIISFTTGFFILINEDGIEHGIFFENGHAIYSTPDLDTEPIFLIFQGYTFFRDTEKSPEGSGWSYIVMSNGIEGWVRNRGFRIY